MGIGRSSFYAAFTDKRSFFIECMDLWAARTLALLEQARTEQAPLDVLQQFFERSVVTGRDSRASWGCLLVNTVLEMAGVDDDLAARASQHLGAMQRVFQACLQDAGAAPAQAEALAATLMLFNQGLRVSSRRGLPAAQHLQTTTTTFALIRSALP
jgi:TetR/AcrR family transcriptional repressor of nem operon